MQRSMNQSNFYSSYFKKKFYSYNLYLNPGNPYHNCSRYTVLKQALAWFYMHNKALTEFASPYNFFICKCNTHLHAESDNEINVMLIFPIKKKGIRIQ